MSYPDVHVHNSTNFSVTGTVHYAACSSDDFNLASGTDFSHSRGVCLITKITALVYLPGGPTEASPYDSSGTSYSQFAVIEKSPGAYTVTRVVSLTGKNEQIIQSGLKQSAAAYGVTPNSDVEVTALLIKQQQEQQIETNWPIRTPKATKHTGTLLCSLRSMSIESEAKEVSCVLGSLEEINSISKLGLSATDIVELSSVFLKTLVKKKFKITYDGNTYKCTNGQSLYWGLSACAEPLGNGKDAVIYTISIAMA